MQKQKVIHAPIYFVRGKEIVSRTRPLRIMVIGKRGWSSDGRPVHKRGNKWVYEI